MKWLLPKFRNEDNTMQKNKLSLKWLVLVFIPVILPFFILYLFPSLSHLPWKWMVIALSEGFALSILLCLLKKNNVSFSSLGFGRGLSKKAIIWGVVAVFVAMSLYPLTEAGIKVFGLPMYWMPRGAEHLTTPFSFVLSFLLLVIFFPIVEEILYRGYLLNICLEKMRGVFMPMIINAIIFGGLHFPVGGPGLALFIFLATFIIVFLYLKFRTIYICIFVHALNNLLGQIFILLIEAS
jgi:membrane protease YdiL (CAAX protease family)